MRAPAAWPGISRHGGLLAQDPWCSRLPQNQTIFITSGQRQEPAARRAASGCSALVSAHGRQAHMRTQCAWLQHSAISRQLLPFIIVWIEYEEFLSCSMSTDSSSQACDSPCTVYSTLGASCKSLPAASALALFLRMDATKCTAGAMTLPGVCHILQSCCMHMSAACMHPLQHTAKKPSHAQHNAGEGAHCPASGL